MGLSRKNLFKHPIQLQVLISSGSFTWPRLAKLIATEVARVGLESLVDSIACASFCK